MKKITILHNSKCSKSREALDWLKTQNYEIEVLEYLKTNLSIDTFQAILDRLNLQPVEVLRTKEKDFLEHVEGKYKNNEELIQFMLRYPKLIERPIVWWEGGGVVARPLVKLIEKLR